MIVQGRHSVGSGELYANVDIHGPRLPARRSDVQLCTFLFLLRCPHFQFEV